MTYLGLYVCLISLSVIHFLSSLSSNHGYFSLSAVFSSFFNLLTNVLNSSHNFLQIQNDNICSHSVVIHLV